VEVSSSNAAGALFPTFGSSRGESLVAERSLQEPLIADRDDEHLLLLVGSGDREALGALFDRYGRLVLGVGQRILRDTAEAEDLVHDVFLFVLDKAGLFDPTKGSARAWLAKVTYCRALDRRKYLMRRCFRDTRGSESSDSQAARWMRSGIVESPELFYWQSYLQRTFDTLPEEQRLTLELHFYQGFTINEISEQMGKSRVNVRNYYYRGLERLRVLMFRRDQVKSRIQGSSKTGFSS
jgi:RNA polymerase sigma-70 factor, ECF subfamily